jgi:hypothetical protein
MNRLLEPETPPTERRRGPRFWPDEEKQSIVVGLILTFILWWPSLLLFGWALNHIHGGYNVKINTTAHGRQFNIELAPQELKQQLKRLLPKPPPPLENFVETNPDAPANVPDKTNNFAKQNQQAAQEKPDPNGHSDHAATKGRKDIESTQIVNGRLNSEKPVLGAPAPAPSKTSQTPSHPEQNPLTGFQKSEGDNKEAFGTNVGKLVENMQNVPEKTMGKENVPLVEGTNPSIPQIDPKHPMPRFRLDQNVRPAIFSDNPVGTSNIGTAGWDARWSNYGEYQQRMVDTVQAEFDNITEFSDAYPPSGTHVAITFRLNSEGKIFRIVKVEGNAGDLGEHYAASALTDRGSYGKWTDDMVAMMGPDTEITFIFYYQ